MLLEENTGYGQRLRAAVGGAQVDPKQTKEIESFLAKVMAAGKTGQSDLRNAILSFSSNPEGQLRDLGAQAGLASEVPVLRTTTGHVAAAAAASMTRQYYMFNGDLLKLFGEVAKRLNRQDALTWARSLDDFPTAIAKQATALGVPAPKLVFDSDRMDATMQTRFRQAHIVYSAELKSFVRQAVEKGVPAQVLDKAASSLPDHATLADALRSVGASVSGLKLPTLEYDRVSTAGGVADRLQAYVHVLGSRAELDQFVAECFKQGLTPSQTVDWAAASISVSPRRGVNGLGSVSKDQLPKLKVDLSRLRAEWKRQFGVSWTAARESYAIDALERALAKDDFYVGLVYQQISGTPGSTYSPVEVLKTLQQHSGLARPWDV